MNSVLETIKSHKLISRGDIVGVAVSGGVDSMVLLDYLKNLQEELDFEIVAIHVDHSIRENSSEDASFVINFCKKNKIRAYKFKIDAPKIAKEKNISLELAAREGRYGIFDSVIKKGIVDKIAIAHHTSDQAETILLRLFRGTGLHGIRGMDYVRDEFYIRPMLDTSKKDILEYASVRDIPYVQDETNFDDSYSRNYIRNKIIPAIQENWPEVIGSLNNFAKACAEDDDYINSQIFDDALIIGNKEVKIPTSYFVYPKAIVNRIIMNAIKKIGINQDIEKRHLDIIYNLAKNGENGCKINLPFSTITHKEYDYVTITNKFEPKPVGEFLNRPNEYAIDGVGKLIIKRVKDFVFAPGVTVFDYKVLPKNAVWRFRQDGDVFTKFNGGTKKLKSFMIDKKIPSRQRDRIPVLASGNEVFVIAGVEVSDKVKITPNTTTAYKVWLENN